MEDQELGLFKEIPGGLRRLLPMEQEWKKAKETLYYQWWRCLNASNDYLGCCAVQGKAHAISRSRYARPRNELLAAVEFLVVS